MCSHRANQWSRFIPAGAGNTSAVRIIRCLISVHPCGRREHMAPKEQQHGGYGSSLRAQGTRLMMRPLNSKSRFIPAGAGNTRHTPHQTTKRSVHPCGRREHGITWIQLAINTGSSLRAQGTQCQLRHPRTLHRFIPAGAGNTIRPSSGSLPVTVHPCGRREHVVHLTAGWRNFGSSLRAQGTPNLTARDTRLSRFIPAGAGNTD